MSTGLDVMQGNSIRVAAKLNRLLLEGEVKETEFVVDWYYNELIKIGMVTLYNSIDDTSEEGSDSKCYVWGLNDK